MKTGRLGIASLAVACVSLLVVADPPIRIGAPQTWDVEKEIPPITYVGAPQPGQAAMGEEFRRSLVENLRYWRDLGMPNPEDLEGLYALSNLDTLTVEQILQTLNPTIPDIRAHVLEQRQALEASTLGQAVRYVFKKVLRPRQEDPTKATPILDQVVGDADPYDLIFDYYGQIRYGLRIPDLDGALRERRTYAQAMPFDARADHLDNAYFGRFPKIDLTKILKAADPSSKIEKWGDIDVSTLVDMKAFKQVSTAGAISRRIVLLPRLTEGLADTKVSSLNDHSIGNHEQGHVNNHHIVQNGHLDRLVDEVYADYIAAAPLDNPIIGQFFAQASKEILNRLGDPKDLNAAQAAKRLSRLAEKGFIRDMSAVQTVDDLKRFYSLANDYDGGQPLRSFLWRARTELGIPSDEFDRFVLSVLPIYAERPSVLSSWASFSIGTRGLLNAIRGYLLNYQITKKIETQLLKDADVQTQLIELARDRLQVKLKIMLIAEMREKGRKLTPNETKTFVQKAVLKEVKIVETEYLDKAHPLRSLKIQDAVKERLRLKEEKQARIAKFKRFLGFNGRPSIKSDYIIPEFMRVFYEMAAIEFPDKIDAIRAMMEKTMQSRSLEVTTESGTRKIVFANGWLDNINPLIRVKITSSFNELEQLQKDYLSLLQTPMTLENEALVEEQKTALKKRYDRVLDGVQEYERTTRAFSLYQPHVWARLGGAILGSLSKRSAKPTEATKTSCQGLFRVI